MLILKLKPVINSLLLRNVNVKDHLSRFQLEKQNAHCNQDFNIAVNDCATVSVADLGFPR